MTFIPNVQGKPLQPCCSRLQTGFFRTGYCETGPQDRGSHTVCAVVTESFLAYSKAVGNDLSTPRPEYGFPGLKPGDRWCLCVGRWQQAYEAGQAPMVDLSATHMQALNHVNEEALREYGLP